MILPPFESSHWDESNGIYFIKIQSLDIKIVNLEFLYDYKHYIISVNFEYFNSQISQIEIILVPCIDEFSHSDVSFMW